MNPSNRQCNKPFEKAADLLPAQFIVRKKQRRGIWRIIFNAALGRKIVVFIAILTPYSVKANTIARQNVPFKFSASVPHFGNASDINGFNALFVSRFYFSQNLR